MAQNITIMGASYTDVPGVTLPKTGGGTALFTDVTDTTATASDVASGKYFYTAAGVLTPGTASGGGGSSRLVIGDFTTSSATGAATTTSLNYTGSGFPIAAMVFIAGGAYNNTSTGNTTWYNSVQRYAVGQWTFSKSVQDSTPDYGTSGTQNQGVTAWIYKNSTSQATTYSRSSAMTTNVLTSSNATNAGATCVRFKGNGKTLSYYVASTSYGLLASTKYTYIVIYSS